MPTTTAGTARLFRCQLEELAPLNDMVSAMFKTNQADFGKASPDNALWEYIVDVLGTGALMYKELQPKKAKTFSMATLLKRIRKENGGAGDVKPV